MAIDWQKAVFIGVGTSALLYFVNGARDMTTLGQVALYAGGSYAVYTLWMSGGNS